MIINELILTIIIINYLIIIILYYLNLLF